MKRLTQYARGGSGFECLDIPTLNSIPLVCDPNDKSHVRDNYLCIPTKIAGLGRNGKIADFQGLPSLPDLKKNCCTHYNPFLKGCFMYGGAYDLAIRTQYAGICDVTVKECYEDGMFPYIAIDPPGDRQSASASDVNWSNHWDFSKNWYR